MLLKRKNPKEFHGKARRLLAFPIRRRFVRGGKPAGKRTLHLVLVRRPSHFEEIFSILLIESVSNTINFPESCQACVTSLVQLTIMPVPGTMKDENIRLFVDIFI